MWKFPTKAWFLRGCLVLGGWDYLLVLNVGNGWEWGLLGLSFIVIMDRSHPFPTNHQQVYKTMENGTFGDDLPPKVAISTAKWIFQRVTVRFEDLGRETEKITDEHDFQWWLKGMRSDTSIQYTQLLHISWQQLSYIFTMVYPFLWGMLSPIVWCLAEAVIPQMASFWCRGCSEQPKSRYIQSSRGTKYRCYTRLVDLYRIVALYVYIIYIYINMNINMNINI